MSFENVTLGDLPIEKVEEIIDDAAVRFGKLCAERFRRAARDIAEPDMDVKTLVMRAASHAVYNKENAGIMREPLRVVHEEQDESYPDLGQDDPVSEPSLAVYLKEQDDSPTRQRNA
jgi:hypothetical protein